MKKIELLKEVSEAIPTIISWFGDIITAFPDAFGISEQTIITVSIGFIGYLGYKVFKRNVI